MQDNTNKEYKPICCGCKEIIYGNVVILPGGKTYHGFCAKAIVLPKKNENK